MSDYKGAASMLPAMPKAKQLLADTGYDADWFRAALAKRRIAACIPSKSNRKIAIPPLFRYSALESSGDASTPNTLRPRLLLGNRPRRSRHLLALINES
jgi:hypothetical protein